MRQLLLLCFLLVTCTCVNAQPVQERLPSAKKRPEPYFSDPNRITFMPFGFIIAYDDANPAIGLAYEYIVNRETGMSVYLPVVFGYAGPEQGSISGNAIVHTSVHAAPGVRFHTGGKHSKRDFATGAGLLIGNNHYRPNADYYNTTFTQSPYNYGMFGLVSDNSYNACRNHFMFGFDARIGWLAERREGSQFFMAVGMHFGGKF